MFLATTQADRQGRHHGGGYERHRRYAAAKFFGNDRCLQQAQAGAAELFRYQQAGHAQGAEFGPDAFIHGGAGLRRLPHRVQFRDARKHALKAVADQFLFFRESEIHLCNSYVPTALGSRGMPRPRSEMMFF